MVINLSVGERIIELRKLQNISQGQLAEALNVSRQAVSKWENDLSCPDPMKMIRLAELLDTDIEYLSTGRRSYGRRPPVVLKSTEVVEKVIEKPVVQIVEKPVVQVVEKIVEVEKPVVQYIEKPQIKKVTRVKYIRNPIEFFAIGTICFLLGILVGILY